MLNRNFISRPAPLPPQAAVFLEAFHLNEKASASDRDDGPPLDDFECQRAITLWEGARSRALEGRKSDHASQATALLVMIDEADRLLEGFYSIGCELKLDTDETAVLRSIRDTAVNLLDWHFNQGASALLPVAEFLGVVR